MKSVLRRVAKRLSYIEDARCLKVNGARRKQFSYSKYSVQLQSSFPQISEKSRVVACLLQGALLNVLFSAWVSKHDRSYYAARVHICKLRVCHVNYRLI